MPIAWKPYKLKAPHALYLRYSACGQIQCLVVRALHLGTVIPLMFDTVSVAMETYYSQCPRQETEASTSTQQTESIVDTSAQQREAIS